jgi:hypothetical protein
LQVVYFGEVTEPYPKEIGTAQFMDAHQSFNFAVGAAGAWQHNVPTVAASTELVARLRISSDKRAWCRIPGKALMALQGWPMDVLHDSDNDRLMTSFAGNAFSAFSVGSMLLGLVVGLDPSLADSAHDPDDGC